MEHRRKQAAISTVIVLLIITIGALAILTKKLSPSKKVMDLNDYYKVKKNEIVIVLENEIQEEKGIIEDGQVYVNYNTVVEHINSRFYWDENESILIYTTPTEVIKSEAGGKNYYTNKSKNSMDHQITKIDGDKVYIALDFVKLYSGVNYKIYKKPNRVVIEHKQGEYLYADTKKNTQLRYRPDIKSDILVQLKEGQKLEFVDSGDSAIAGFSKVQTEDGIIGYVKTKYVKNTYYETVESNFKEPEYTNIHKDYKINLAWHQVTNQTANNNLLYMLEAVKGVNTISPTWFSVISESGELSSLASERYVQRAHELGIEVWALVDDFNPDVDMYNLLSVTSRREKLINNIIAYGIQYNLDGINIDFEKISLNAGIHYIQFIRELSVKCRNNGIILSVDNYVPTEYSSYYNREEQGNVIDYVITMAYDEHHAGSEESGSVASYNFVKTGVENTLKEVPKEKVIIGIPFFTRLWKETPDGDGVKVTSQAYGMREGMDVLKRNNAKIVWDEELQQNYGEFKEDGATFKMWLEDEKSLEAKLKVISDNDVAGIAEWKLGLEDKKIWNTIIKYIN